MMIFLRKFFSAQDIRVQPPELDCRQKMIFEAACQRMQPLETECVLLVQQAGLKPDDRLKFNARVFGFLFPLHVLIAAGTEMRGQAEAVYRLLFRKACLGLKLNLKKAGDEASETLREHSRALAAEKNNVGSGQFALAALFLQIFSAHEQHAALMGPLSERVGPLVAENLGVWAGLYKDFFQQPMQTYTRGFQPSAEDTQSPKI